MIELWVFFTFGIGVFLQLAVTVAIGIEIMKRVWGKDA